MQNILRSVHKSIADQNWYASLFVSLTLPDICVALEYGETSGSRYIAWFDENLPQYQDFLSGNDCYALRCALLHQGKGDISEQKKKIVLEHYVFLTSGAHCNLFDNITINGETESFLQLNVGKFCKDLTHAAENWLQNKFYNLDIEKRNKETICIHEPGYTYKGVIRFS